jgi:CheY-like chemotaxis protein
LQLSDATPPDTSSCQDNDYASLLFGKTVLLVEDNEINQMVATEILSQWGIQVEVASNGRDALEQLSNRVPDIVLTDIQMPVMDGCELATQIRHTAHLSHLPIIAITADAMTGDRERFLSSGINDYISKPFDAQKLAELLVHWISSTTASSSAGRGSPSSPSTISLPSLTPGSDELLSSWQDLLPSQFLALTLDSSLNRLNGNVSLYLCILEAFCTHHSAISDKILDALNQADSILALRTIHSYRSLAHAIGAERAVMMGRKVEEHLRHGHYKKAIERLSELRSQMDYVIDSFTLLTAVYVNPLDQPFEERIHLFCQKMANSLSSGCAETIQDYVRSFKEISQKLGDDADIHSLCLDFDHGNLHSALQSLEMTLPDLERFS